MMNIDRFLDAVTTMAWVAFATIVIVMFVTTLRKRNLRAALKGLVSFRNIFLLLLVVVLNLFAASLVFIEPQNVGAVVSILAPNGIRNRPMQSGLHWVVPLAESVVIYPLYWQTYTVSGRPMEGAELGNDSIMARTSDGQAVFMDCTIIFRLDEQQAVQIHRFWQNRYVKEYIRPTTRAIVRAEVSQFTVDEVNSSQRKDLELSLNLRMSDTLESHGFMLNAFLLRNITFSPEYISAVESKQVAFQGAIQKQYEALQIERLAVGRAAERVTLAKADAQAIEIKAQAQAKARVVLAEAQAQALRRISEPLEENRDLLTYQYIDRLSPGIKVMLVPQNAPFLLPLPALEPTDTIFPTLTLTETSTLTDVISSLSDIQILAPTGSP